MTITNSRYVETGFAPNTTDGKRVSKPPPKVWYAVDPPFRGYQAAPTDGYQNSTNDTAIVIDNGMIGCPLLHKMLPANKLLKALV